MPTLAIDKGFLSDLVKLEKPVERRVIEVIEEFGNTTDTGLYLGEINNARNPQYRSIQIDQFFRGIVLAPEAGDVYTLLVVRPHDDAQKWAERFNVSVNTATGGIEIREEAAIEETLPELKVTAKSTESLFKDISDSDLKRLGIDDQTLQFARALMTVEQLDAAKHKLPDTQWDVLFGLAAGYTPDEVWADMGAGILQEPIDVSDLDSAILRSPNRVALAEDNDDLLKAFAYPFATWRVYLHPSQRRIVEASYIGPARVTGGPGTGKTVVALHRAHNLAKRNDGRVLLTTFTATLTDSLQSNLNMIVDDDDVEDRIEIINIDKLARRVFRKQHRRSPKILSDDEEADVRRSIIEERALTLTEAVLESEWRHVVLALQITSEEEYFAAKQSGSGRVLTVDQAAATWQGIQFFEQALSQLGAWTHDTVRREATRLLIEASDKPYRHIVVDEAQDLTADQWRLLRAAVPYGSDDIFIAGDTHQRIYDNQVTLRDVGIDIQDRSAELGLNYRTTAEILGWSLGLLRGEPIDDMNGGLDSIARCRSAVHGPPPRLLALTSSQAEEQSVAETVRDWISEGVDPSEIGVATRARWLGGRIAGLLRSEGIPTFDLAEGLNLDGAVSVGTMHGMKGLEFRCVAVAGVSARLVPEPKAVLPADLDKQVHEQDIEREKCLLFVACTRAREELVVTWHGERSDFLSAPIPTD